MIVMKGSNHFNAIFWKNVHDSWCSHLPDNIKEAYDLFNHAKIPILRDQCKQQAT